MRVLLAAEDTVGGEGGERGRSRHRRLARGRLRLWLAEVAVRVDADADAARREERGCRQAELARTDVGHAVGQRWVIAI